MNNINPFNPGNRKTLTAVVTALLSFATNVVLSSPAAITSAEWLGGAVGLAGSLGVYAVANK